MMIMIVLHILTVVKLQVNSITPTSFAPSIPTMLPNFSELNQSQKLGLQEPKYQKPKHEEHATTLHSCLTRRNEHCMKRGKLAGKVLYGRCLYHAFRGCLILNKNDVLYPVIEICVKNCLLKSKGSFLLLGTCLEDCGEKHLRSHHYKNTHTINELQF